MGQVLIIFVSPEPFRGSTYYRYWMNKWMNEWTLWAAWTNLRWRPGKEEGTSHFIVPLPNLSTTFWGWYTVCRISPHDTSEEDPSPIVITSPLAYFFAHGGQPFISPIPPLWNRMPSFGIGWLVPASWTSSPISIPAWFYSYLIYFLCLLLFLCLLGVNGFLRSVSSTFCFLTLHILLIQPSVADDSHFCISSLILPAQPNRYFQSLLRFLILVSYSTSYTLARYFSPFDFPSKSALSVIVPIFPST